MSLAGISALALFAAGPVAPVIAVAQSGELAGAVAGQSAAATEKETPPPLVAVPVEIEGPLIGFDEIYGAQDSDENFITVTAREETPGDPMERLNAQSFEVIQKADEAVVAPLAKGYEGALPDPVRSGLRNFLRNLEQPVIFLNFLLQGKPVSALKTVARFGINSTIGIAGLVDVAKRDPINLPYKQNSFANTFACYGIGPGPFLFLPLIGPTTVRDMIGVGLDKMILPAVVGPPLTDPVYGVTAFTVDSLNDRIEMDAEMERIREEEGDPYAATRDLYLKQREAEIKSTCGKGDYQPDPDLPVRAGKGEN